jgi:hypothetical protein
MFILYHFKLLKVIILSIIFNMLGDIRWPRSTARREKPFVFLENHTTVYIYS